MIVAEISANHKGSLNHALDIIDAAAEAGADAVKFQTWEPGALVKDRDYVMQDGPWKGQNLAALYDEAWTPWDWHPKLFDHAHALGMQAFSTAFDVEALKFLESLECPRYKVSSFELVDHELIKAIGRTGKPMIMSTGMASKREIAHAVAAAFAASAINVTLLKCTSAYPADASDANLATIPSLAKDYPWCGIGLSDHTPGIGVAVAAAALGATMIEKHLTLKRSDGGPDSAFSMEPDEFKAMVQACRQATNAIGKVTYGPTEAEQPMLEVRRVRNSHKVPRGT